MIITTFNRRQQMTLDTLNVPVILTRLGNFSSLRKVQLLGLVQMAHPFGGHVGMTSSNECIFNDEVESVYNHIVALYDHQEAENAKEAAVLLEEFVKTNGEALGAIPYRANK